MLTDEQKVEKLGPQLRQLEATVLQLEVGVVRWKAALDAMDQVPESARAQYRADYRPRYDQARIALHKQRSSLEGWVNDPGFSYLLNHPKARLSDQERRQVVRGFAADLDLQIEEARAQLRQAEGRVADIGRLPEDLSAEVRQQEAEMARAELEAAQGLVTILEAQRRAVITDQRWAGLFAQSTE